MPEIKIHPDYRGCRQTAQLTATGRQTVELDVLVTVHILFTGLSAPIFKPLANHDNFHTIERMNLLVEPWIPVQLALWRTATHN
jgi:hypothetical protein